MPPVHAGQPVSEITYCSARLQHRNGLDLHHGVKQLSPLDEDSATCRRQPCSTVNVLDARQTDQTDQTDRTGQTVSRLM